MASPTLTEYVVLCKKDGAAFEWYVVSPGDTIPARDGNAAIKAVAAPDAKGNTYVAVPARSWNPIKVTAKVETTLIFEEASA